MEAIVGGKGKKKKGGRGGSISRLQRYLKCGVGPKNTGKKEKRKKRGEHLLQAYVASKRGNKALKKGKGKKKAPPAR